jgi:tripartite-type tricarboxylate transporter receptor subunit TctC
MMGTIGTQSINPSLYKKMPYDAAKDFVPITRAAMVPNLLVVNKDAPFNTLPEMMAYGKANPGKLNYASQGNGSVSHIGTEIFKQNTGVDIVHVPYKGVAPALTDLIGGHTQMVMTSLPSAMNHVQSGRLKALAVGSEQRSSFMPNLPTISEAGVSGYMAEFWWGIAVPAKTPIEIVNRLGSELSKAMQSPDLKQKFAAEGAEPSNMGREPFTQFVRNEITRWRKVAQETGIKPE